MATEDLAAGGDDRYPVAADPGGGRPISPTDVSQFIRLDQCRRYLRLRLHERVAGGRFLRDFGVAPQSIQPLLTRSGAAFEKEIVAAVGARYPTLDLAAGVDPAKRDDDNAAVIAAARELPAGETTVLVQPRLAVDLDGWRVRGDADLVRFERDGDGALRVLIADVKSTTTAKVEHRLQVAFYHEMIAALLAAEGVPWAAMETAILYRDADRPGGEADATEVARRQREREAATRWLNAPGALLETVADPESYRASVRDLVTGSRSVAAAVADAPFATVPYHLTYKCDGCLYNEFCMKWSAERDDLSLLPHLADREKSALQGAGVASMRQLATLKVPRPPVAGNGRADLTDLVPAPGEERLVRRLGATWPVGPRVDELVHRARRYRKFKGDAIEFLPFIPSKGHGSLPHSDAEQNPNLVRVYVDAQHDYLHDRIYLLGALVTACEHGQEVPARRRRIVHLTDGPPATAEAEARLFVRWIDETLRAIVEVAAPDEAGQARAPIHVVFWDRFAQKVLLDGLGRHAERVLGATPLYDFLTQLAAFDSPVVSFLEREIRELKNYPMVCQSLQAVAAFLKFDWNAEVPYREVFNRHLFDFWRKRDGGEGADGESPWYTGRARFSSQIPLEFAYAAWGELAPPRPGERDETAAYRGATVDLLRGFQGRRLEAIEHVARDFAGNRETEQRAFDLPTLDRFDEQARGLAQALDEFVTIERHVELGAWKGARLAPPERRVLAGDSLIVRYHEADQGAGIAEGNREHEERHRLRERQQAAFRAAKPDAKKVTLAKAEKAESDWSHEGWRFRLRLDLSGVDCGLDEALALTTLKPDDSVLLLPRWTVDGRLPAAQQRPLTPTPKRMLYGVGAKLIAIDVERDGDGWAIGALVEIEMHLRRGGHWSRGFAFPQMEDWPLVDGALYTLEPDPNSFYGYWAAKVVEGLSAGGANTLYDRLARPAWAHATWPAAAAQGQARFLAGLDALHAAGALHGFEESKRQFVGRHGETPTLLVQGPPGTGKSYSTAFALFARLQGALAADLRYRVVVCCKTHAATDVLLDNLLRVRDQLAALRTTQPAIFAAFLDERVFDVPLFRVRPRGDVPPGVVALRREEELEPGEARTVEAIEARRWCLIAATPGAVYGAIKERWPKNLFGHDLVDCLVLDEASQMNLPEAAMAALPLTADGQLIVVGDHRQMPPIVKHDWEGEPRRTFRAYETYRSLFDALRTVPTDGTAGPPMIKFEESFRLHADMAEFLRREIYHLDGIAYHSRRHDLLPPTDDVDGFVASVLTPEHPLVVVVHDEAGSQLRNRFEQGLVAPLLAALTERGFDAGTGLGVVVPHRAQRALLQDAMRRLTAADPARIAEAIAAVDTVERFQGGERTVIVVSATESDPAYLLAAGKFLLDPRRLTVALSRAKQKMVLVAARSVFDFFSADEETFANAQLWKNLLRRTCTAPLWQGTVEGVGVEVWGNDPAPAALYPSTSDSSAIRT